MKIALITLVLLISGCAKLPKDSWGRHQWTTCVNGVTVIQEHLCDFEH